MIVEYRKFSPVLLIQELGLFKYNKKKKSQVNQSQLLWKGKKKKRVSCLIITEHFEGNEKAFFQAEIRYSVYKKKIFTTQKQI